MHYCAKDLKLVPLKDVPKGSLVEIVGRKDIPLVLRLQDKGLKARIMVIGGDHSFHVAEWHDTDALGKVVCATDDLRIRLNESNDKIGHTDPGVMTLHSGGAFLSAAPTNHAFYGVQIALDSWDDTDKSCRADQVLAFPNWEFGKASSNGEFVSIFQRK